MKTKTFCRFKQGNRRTEGFIDSHAAKVGNSVEFIESGSFWEVISVGVEMDASIVSERGRGYKDFQVSTRGGGIDE